MRFALADSKRGGTENLSFRCAFQILKFEEHSPNFIFKKNGTLLLKLRSAFKVIKILLITSWITEPKNELVSIGNKQSN